MTTLTHRYKAWLVLEAETPFSVGNGREGLTTDRLVAHNAAGYPCIPGTGLAGALRAALSDLSSREIEDIFGFTRGKKGVGSRLIVNSAHLLAADGISVLEGLPQVDTSQPYYQQLNALPVRDHVRINDRGAAMDKGKFDEQVCYKGARFVGSLELLGTEDEKSWQQILNQFAAPFFRIGGGTRKGFGKLKIVKLQSKTYDLNNAKDREAYLKDDNSMQIPAGTDEKDYDAPATKRFRRYALQLKPRDFFIFGAGFGDDEADDIYKTEPVIDWSKGKPELSKQKILIPASSVKGALRHRLAFHYNKEKVEVISNKDNEDQFLLNKKLEELNALVKLPADINSDDPVWEETIKRLEAVTFENNTKGKESERNTDKTAQNKAVQTLFGFAANQTEGQESQGQRGNILFSDVFLQPATEKVFDHVRIDRFTGGASEGALFQEKTIFTEKIFVMELFVAENALKDPDIEKAWHASLDDLCEGRLPLGGKTTKGHGFFTGTCNQNLKTSSNYETEN